MYPVYPPTLCGADLAGLAPSPIWAVDLVSWYWGKKEGTVELERVGRLDVRVAEVGEGDVDDYYNGLLWGSSATVTV